MQLQTVKHCCCKNKKEHASQKEVTGTHRFRKEIDLFTMGQRISSHSNAAWDGTMVNIHVRLSWINFIKFN